MFYNCFLANGIYAKETIAHNILGNMCVTILKTGCIIVINRSITSIYIMVKPNFKGINRDINVIYALGHYISL